MRGCSYLGSTILAFIEWEIIWFVSVFELFLCLMHPFGALGASLLPGKAAKHLGCSAFLPGGWYLKEWLPHREQLHILKCILSLN